MAFANNALFWVAYTCLECTDSNTELGLEMQAMGVQAIRKVLEESDFLKMLIGV